MTGIPAILHVGFGKTGSTSVQQTLAAEGAALAARGWRYARFTQNGREITNQGRAFANVYETSADNFHGNLHAGKTTAEQAPHFRAEMDRALAPQSPVIFSGEFISSLSRSALTRLRDDFLAKGYEPRVIALIRAPGELVHSLAQGRIRSGWPDLLPKRSMKGEYRTRINNLRSVFPEAGFHPFADARAHPKGPAGFVADLIEPGLSDPLATIAANPSMGDHATRLILHVNTLAPMFIESDRRQLSPVRMAGDIRSLERLPGPAFFLRSHELRPIRKEMREEIAWLNQELGRDFTKTRPSPEDTPLVWTDAQAQVLPGLLRHLPHHLAVAAANYFEGRDDVPAALAALPQRYRIGGNLWLRFRKTAPGVATAERIVRRIRGQW